MDVRNVSRLGARNRAAAKELIERNEHGKLRDRSCRASRRRERSKHMKMMSPRERRREFAETLTTPTDLLRLADPGANFSRMSKNLRITANPHSAIVCR